MELPSASCAGRKGTVVVMMTLGNITLSRHLEFFVIFPLTFKRSIIGYRRSERAFMFAHTEGLYIGRYIAVYIYIFGNIYISRNIYVDETQGLLMTS